MTQPRTIAAPSVCAPARRTLTPTELFAQTAVASGTMTNRLDRPEQQGLVTRSQSG